MKKPFGYFLGVDIYGVPYGYCDDMERAYRFLEELVIKLGMTPMAPPYVIHGPSEFLSDTYRIERYPDKAGISAWQPLIESGIQIHTLEPKRFISIDIFTCGQLDQDMVIEYVKKWYKPQKVETYFLTRGMNYEGD